ncbi:MAG: urease accessory protein UreD [Methyloceanibacter sp.]
MAAAAVGRRLVSGRLELEFAAAPDGRTYLRRQFASYPFHVCRVQFQDSDIPDLATLYVQSCSGGVYEDDRLKLALAAGENAKAHVSTQAATVVHSMPAGRAEQIVRLDCAHGSYLEYLPDPQILFPGSSCRSAISVRLSGNGIGVVSDSFLQHDPDGKDGTFSAYWSEIVVEAADGEVLTIDRLRIDGRAFQGRRPGVSGSFAAQGTLVVAGLEVPFRAISDALRTVSLDCAEAAIGSSQLPKSAGMLVRVLAADGAALKRAMHMAWCAARLALQGSLPVERRK